MGVSMMTLGQSETWSGVNYRMMTQARYGAESGLNAAANFLVNGSYAAPLAGTCSTTDTLSCYTLTTSPVTCASGTSCSGSSVTLSSTSSSATYPVASVETAFQSAIGTGGTGTLTMGTTTVHYTVKSATLIAMSSVTTQLSPLTVATIQTWSITADGTIAGVRNATEEVTGIIERQVSFSAVANPGYGTFATSTNCGSVGFTGAVVTGSYNSTTATVSGGKVVTQNYGGDIGSNGSVNLTGAVTINGTVSTPGTGVGTGCTNSFVGSTETGCATGLTGCVAGGVVSMSQLANYPAPTMPSVTDSNVSNVSIVSGMGSTCASLGIASGCSGSGNNFTLAPGTYGNISLTGATTLTLSPPGTFNIQSLTDTGSGTITIANTAASTVNVFGNLNLTGSMSLSLTGSSPVTMNLMATGSGNTMAITGDGIVNASSTGVPTPANLTINYAGTSGMSIVGGSKSAAVVDAPNAPITIVGSSSFYGSLIGSTITDVGGATIYYDRSLGSSSSTPIATVGNFMMDSFSWSRF